MAWHDDAELGRESALAIARHLDRPRTAYAVEVKGGHVWHCSLSLRAEEGRLTDDRWGAIATDFVQAMEFDDVGGSKAACRWAAVRHGVSLNGNDHIHIAVNLVREDGTKASIHRDFARAQQAARDLEKKYGLEQLESVAADRATRGYHPAEREAQARARARAKYDRALGKGQMKMPWERLASDDRRARVAAEMITEQPRHNLARTVRACATASDGEAEFVRRMRRAGVLIRPRYADGRMDVITGYSVASRPQFGERPIWYGGGHLGRDLALPRLRAEWPDTPSGASEAAAEWNAAKRHRRPVAPGREAQEPDPALWAECTRRVTELREQLRSIPVDDRDTWARVARETSGAFAAWSRRVEEEPGPLAATADALARSAQTRRHPVQPKWSGMASASGAAMLLIQASRGGHGTAAEAIMLRQLANLAKALYDMHRAAGEARRAAEIAAAVRGQLARVAERLPDPSTGTASLDFKAAGVICRPQQGQEPPARESGSPVPNKLEPQRPRRTTAVPGRGRGWER